MVQSALSVRTRWIGKLGSLLVLLALPLQLSGSGGDLCALQKLTAIRKVAVQRYPRCNAVLAVRCLFLMRILEAFFSIPQNFSFRLSFYWGYLIPIKKLLSLCDVCGKKQLIFTLVSL